MNNETGEFINDALRMGRELMLAGATVTASEGATDESAFAMDAGSALLRLAYMVVKMDDTVIEQAEMNMQQAQEIAQLNTRLRDMAEDANKAASLEESLEDVWRRCDVYKSERNEYREKYELMNAVNDSLESILDDTERQRDALKAERDNAWLELERIRHAVNANPEESTLDEVRRVVHQRDLARAKLERTSNDINALIEKYS